MTDLLEGVRVLDLTNVLAGPYCSYQLALLGADVIKIESPEGDLARFLGGSSELNECGMGASFLAQNAGKRSVVLNLKSESEKEKFLRLVETADVLIENYRPGVMDRLGFGYEALKLVNPGLVYCAISGFGQTGPLRDNPAYDQIIQGLAGVMSVTGTPDTAPVRVGYPVCDTLGGLFGAFGVVAALFRKQRSGQGAMLDVSMLESTLSAMGWPISNFLSAGISPIPLGNENATAAPSGTFRTGNGLLNIAANKQSQFEALCDVIERPDLPGEKRFENRESRKTFRTVLNDLIETALSAKGAREWETLLNKAGVPAGRVLTVPEVLQEPQVQERRATVTFDAVDGISQRLTVVRNGFLVDGIPAAPRIPPPVLGAHTDEVLAALGATNQMGRRP